MIEENTMARYDTLIVPMLKKEIKTFVEKTVKETLRAELARTRAAALPLVSKEEMADIAKRHKRPHGRAVRTIKADL